MNRLEAIVAVCGIISVVQGVAFVLGVDGQVLAITSAVFAAAIGYLAGRREG